MLQQLQERAATPAKTDAKVDKTSSEDRTPEVRPHPGNLQAQLLHQQRTVGNQAVQRLIRSGSLNTPLKPSPLIRRQPLEREEEHSSPSVQRPAIKNELHAPIARPVTQIAPATIQSESVIRSDSQRSNTHTHQSRGALRVQRHWYNFDIPFTNYQFDPSLEGIKTAANVVKDTAVAGFDWIVDEIKGLVNSGIDWLKEKWNDLEAFATSAFDAATDSFTNIINLLKNPLGFIADAIMSFDAAALSKAWAKFSGFISTVANGFKAMTDNLLQQVNKVWGGISGFATSLLDKVSGLTQNFIFRKLPDALQNIAFSVIDTLKSLWKSIDDGWNKLFKKIKTWVDSAIDKVFAFVRRVLSFGINVVITGIIQFGQIVLFLKDLFSNPKNYVAILAEKSVHAFDGVESRFAGVVSQYFGSATKAAPATATTTTVHRQPASGTAAEPKTSATWGDIGSGILEMMGKKWKEFKSNPLSVVTGLLMDMIFPMIGNIKDVIELYNGIKKIVTGPLSAGSLEEFWTSLLLILDIPILIYKTIVSILMRSLMVPLIVASFIPHPLVKAIAAAVGYALLGAFVQGEFLNIGQKLLLLKTGATVKSQKEDAYNRVADSLIALAMTAVIILIMLLLHFIANVMKGVYNFVKGKVFSVKEPVSVEGRSAGEGKGQKGQGPDADKPQSKGPSDADTAAKGRTADGKHEVRITQEGECLICSDCQALRKLYAEELDNPANASLKAELETADKIADPEAKRVAETELEAKLATARSGRFADLQGRLNLSNESVKVLTDNGVSPGTVERLAGKGIPPNDIALYADVPHGLQIMEGLIDQGIQPHVAERVTSLAQSSGTTEQVNSLVSSGGLRNPQALRAVLERLNAGEVGAFRELDIASRLAKDGHQVELGGQGDVVDHGRPGDPAVPREAIQAKNVSSPDPARVTENLREAADQLSGARGEVPQPGFTRVADINIMNPDNPLFNADRPTLGGAVRDALVGRNMPDGSPIVQTVRVTNHLGTQVFVGPGYLP